MAKHDEPDSAHQAETPPAPPKLEAPRAAPQKRNRSKELLQSKHRAEIAQRAKQDADDNANKVYFLQCPRVGWNKEKNTGHMAAFLTEKPRAGGMIEPENWESFLHVAGDPWTKPFIPCQECYIEGEQRAWQARVRPVRQREEDGSYVFVIADSKYGIGEVPREILNIKREQIAEIQKGGAS